ncbi:MAG: hypothetical protein J7L14_00780 [Candidatus Diapherotrites archaeon]|nr:hypothetical protein [Candidatus Diapherotrites archaeon]
MTVIVALTGLARAGKDTAADILAKKGFVKLVFSDFLKEEVRKRNLELNKMNLSIVGDELRAKHGRGVLAKYLWEKAKNYSRVVAVGVRSPEEADYLREKAEKFLLIEISAKPEIRFQRRSDADPQTFEEFMRRDERDIKNKGLAEVLKMADVKIDNNGTIAELEERIVNTLRENEIEVMK